MPQFSIVIPCFNSYRFMNKCLENFEKQTYKNFELIIVDDCSKDNSFENLKKYKENSKMNIKLLRNQENLGPGRTRNNGLENAGGKYILFVDSDDYLEINCLEILNETIERNKCDCIIFDYYFVTKNRRIYQRSISKVKEGLISTSDALIYSTGSVCGKLYLLENIKKNNIKFPSFKKNEDMPFNKIALSQCNKIYYYNKPLYNYIKNEASIMNNIVELDYKDAQDAFNLVEDNLKTKYMKEVKSIYLVEFLYASTMTLIERGEKTKNVKLHIKKGEEKYLDLYKNEVIDNLPKHQRICIKNIKSKNIMFLRILYFLKQLVKKIR